LGLDPGGDPRGEPGAAPKQRADQSPRSVDHHERRREPPARAKLGTDAVVTEPSARGRVEQLVPTGARKVVDERREHGRFSSGEVEV
jgi:hypothetical protein